MFTSSSTTHRHYNSNATGSDEKQRCKTCRDLSVDRRMRMARGGGGFSTNYQIKQMAMTLILENYLPLDIGCELCDLLVHWCI